MKPWKTLNTASAFTVAAGAKFDELRQTNGIVHQTLGAGGSAEDCCVNLADHNDALIKRVMQSERYRTSKDHARRWQDADLYAHQIT